MHSASSPPWLPLNLLHLRRTPIPWPTLPFPRPIRTDPTSLPASFQPIDRARADLGQLRDGRGVSGGVGGKDAREQRGDEVVAEGPEGEG